MRSIKKSEGGSSFACFVNSSLPVSPTSVKSGRYCSIAERVYAFIHLRDRILVVSCYCVALVIMHAKA